MLSALMADDDGPATTAPVCSLAEQKRYICRYADALPRDDKRELGRLTHAHGCEDKLRPCADGTVINLDNVPEACIAAMYNLLAHKRNVNARGLPAF